MRANSSKSIHHMVMWAFTPLRLGDNHESVEVQSVPLRYAQIQ
jgi:hypothetical protein